MRLNLKSAFLFIALLLIPYFSDAYHIIGGEIYYECLGDDPNTPGAKVYRLILKIYRDCAGNGQDFDSLPGAATGTVTIYQGDSDVPYITTLNLDAPTVTLLDPDASNPCLIVPPNICVQEGIYEFEVSLPVIDESYHITYQRCCRNSSISNIYSPDETGATYTVELTPTAQQTCNNSPSFVNFPPIIICVGQMLDFDHSATDPEGDQLVYEFCSPFKGGGLFGNPLSPTGVYPNPDLPPPYEEVDFIVPTFSALEPMAGDPVVNIDAFTGLITGIPEVQGQFVVGVCVKEYRNGELLSIIQRDFQFNVAFCEPTVVAALEGDLVDDVYEFLSCDNQTFTFENSSYQSSFIDEYYWFFDFPNGGFTTNESDPTIEFPGPGEYEGVMILNPGTQCSDSVLLNVKIAAPVLADFEFEYDTCVAGPVNFIQLANSINGNGTIVSYNWDFGDGMISNDPNPVHEYEEPGVYDVLLQVVDEWGCIDEIVQQVTWFPVPPIIIIEPTSFVGCPPAEITFENLSTPIDDTYDIIWDFGDGGMDSSISPVYTFNQPGLFDINIEITSPIGCYTEKSFIDWIDIDSMPIADFDITPERGSNFEPEIMFFDQSIRAIAWNWTFDEWGSTIMQNPTFVFPDTGLMDIQLIITHRYGCMDTLVQQVDIEPQVTYFLPNAFTPNQDGKNEEFRGGGYFRGIRDFNLKIMNRWGSVIYETNDPGDGWNGRIDNVGRLSPNGVYLVYVSYTGPRGMPKTYKGYATLVR